MAEQNQDERTEDPTQKKLDDAHKRGDVAKSQEVNAWFVLGAATLVLAGFSGGMADSLTTSFRGLISNAHQIPVDGDGLLALSQRLGMEVFAAVAMPFLVFVLAALAGNLVQHRLVWSAEQLKPKFSKVSPLAGVKRLFSKQSLMMFVKGLIKLALIGTVMTLILWPYRNRLETLIFTDLLGALALTHSLALYLMATVVAIMGVVAIADFIFMYRQWHERQKMSKQEVKEEYKQSEGDPAIKARIRQLRVSRSRQRMMAAVPDATVVIANPTHYAVALKYNRDMNAPRCVAKGVDVLALKIREVAEAHSVPVVENVPLARALHAAVEIDQDIPPEHYKAVAEVIGYVMGLRGGRA